LGNGNLEEFERLASELEELRRTATTDAVTGLPNPGMTQTSLLFYVEAAAREGATLSACIADLDNFKQINDNYGHLEGNEVLRQLGERLRGSLDSGQHAGRWGGDEFLLLFPRTDLPAARELADKVRRGVDGSAFHLLDGTSLPITVTIGVASGDGEGLEANRLFHAADEDLRETKRGGRNRVGSGRLV
jgi:two-component system cell cycle response regulator